MILLKLNPSLNLKLKMEDEPKAMLRHNIYSRIKYECKECHAEFKNKIALTTHSYSHNRKYLENTEYCDENSSQNMKEFFITDKAGNYIEDIDEAINNSLEEIKNCYQFRRVLNIRSRPSVSTRSEPKKKLRSQKYSSKLTILLIMQYMIMVTSNNGWILKKKYMKAMATTLSFSD